MLLDETKSCKRILFRFTRLLFRATLLLFFRLLCLRISIWLASGGTLKTPVVRKICLSVALRHNIPVRPSSSEEESYMEKVKTFKISEDPFYEKLQKAIVVSKNKDARVCFWPDQNFRSRLLRQYNLRVKVESDTMYTKTGLLCQLLPSLTLTYAYRNLLKIKPGTGHIINFDESMIFRFDESSKSWTF